MDFTQEELQNIRHIVGASSGLSKKVKYYSSCISDQNAIEILERIDTALTDNKNYLCGKL